MSANMEHRSVMTKEVLELLALKDGDVVLDATAGAGGHSEALLRAADVRVISLDADASAVANVRARLALFGKRSEVIEGNFSDASGLLAGAGVSQIDKALFDLGWNRGQLFSGRGFSLLQDDPLVMSYGAQPASGATAREIVNEWAETTLADIIFGYGEERYARRIAREIVASRETTPIETTVQLVEIISRAVPAAYRRGRLHFATKTFQALRIAVNDELGVIDRGVRGAWSILAEGGRIVVITFHSIEDRAVKRLFLSLAKEEEGILITKKPIPASREESLENPSARSAKVRCIEKVGAGTLTPTLSRGERGQLQISAKFKPFAPQGEKVPGGRMRGVDQVTSNEN